MVHASPRLGHIHTALANLSLHACNHSVAPILGISAVPEQVRLYARTAAALPQNATICETGFNCGHSTTTFLEANPTANVINFDLPLLPWAKSARAYIKTRYGERVEIRDGPSKRTILEHASRKAFRCDLVVVDGEHTYAGTLLDLVRLLQFAPCGAPVLVDDVCDRERCHGHAIPILGQSSSRFINGTNHPSLVGPTMAWYEAVRAGHVELVQGWFGVAPDRGWVLGRAKCGANGLPVPESPRYTLRPPMLRYEPDVPSKHVTAAVDTQYKQAARLWEEGKQPHAKGAT